MLIQIEDNVEVSDRDNDREYRDKVLTNNNLEKEEISKTDREDRDNDRDDDGNHRGISNDHSETNDSLCSSRGKNYSKTQPLHFLQQFKLKEKERWREKHRLLQP